jgi:type I restriction enzyme S subunit
VSDLNSAFEDRYVVQAANYVSTTQARRLGARICPPGTVLFPKVGGALMTNKRRQLQVAGVFDNNLMGVVPRSVDSDWLYFFMCHLDLAALANTQSLPSIRQTQVAAIPSRAPSLGDQRQIAARLTQQLAGVATSRAACRDRSSDLDGLRELVYRQAFETIIPLTVERSHETEPTGWWWVRLADVARLESGHTPSRDRPDWWGGDIPWIALPDIRALDGEVTFETGERTNPEGIAHSSARVLPVGTVAMSRTASVGFVTRMGRPMATSQDFVNWVCGPDLDPEFLMHLLIRSRPYVRELASGAIHKTVYMPTVKAFKVCIPSIQEQRRIVSELRFQLSAIEEARLALETQREAIGLLPAALLRSVFENPDAASFELSVRRVEG